MIIMMFATMFAYFLIGIVELVKYLFKAIFFLFWTVPTTLFLRGQE